MELQTCALAIGLAVESLGSEVDPQLEVLHAAVHCCIQHRLLPSVLLLS